MMVTYLTSDDKHLPLASFLHGLKRSKLRDLADEVDTKVNQFPGSFHGLLDMVNEAADHGRKLFLYEDELGDVYGFYAEDEHEVEERFYERELVKDDLNYPQ